MVNKNIAQKILRKNVETVVTVVVDFDENHDSVHKPVNLRIIVNLPDNFCCFIVG